MKSALLILATFALSTSAQQPDKTLPPEGFTARYVTRGVGVQIYQCTASGTAYTWTLQGPEADLLDSKTFAAVGKHGAGPSWAWIDGSSVTGKVLEQQPSGDATANIPWLLLQATSTGANGALSTVNYVRRSDTDGGIPAAAGCSEATVNTVTRVPYKAVYTFYAPAAKPTKKKHWYSRSR